MENAMTLEEFRQARESGVDLYAEHPQQDQEDAAPEQEAEQEQEVEQDVEQPEEQQEESESEQPIPEEHKSAWAKRAERERKKAAEEVKAQYEAELAKYKRFFDESGIDPEQAVKVLEQNRLKEEARRNVMAEANQLAYQYGWDDQQTEEYVNKQSELLSRQMQQENEMRELRVSVAINDLADKPDYPGIKTMKPQIMEFVKKNPSVPVEQAYWAVGGASLAQQLKREAEQREIAKRSQTTRKVVTDAGKAVGDKNSLPPEAVEFMRREGLSEDQVRFLLSDSPKNLEDYRKMRRK